MRDLLIAEEASHVAPFPQIAPIVVSRILRVSRSSGYEPGSKNLQNKQGTGGGVLVGSPMLKLVREIESVKMLVL